MENLTASYFLDPEKARLHLEGVCWPDGPVCRHCGSSDASRLPNQRGRATKAHPEGAVRAGVLQCKACRKQFTVTVGTVFERSKVPLHKWLLATHLLCSSKKGMSAHQLHRMLGVTYKTAWFMAHRIREAMRSDGLGPLGSDGATVEVDETYIGRRKGVEVAKGGGSHKMAVLSLVDRNSGKVRSFSLDKVNGKEIAEALERNLSRSARLMTDELPVYVGLGWNFAGHDTINHRSGEYVRRGDRTIHTNTVEGFFSIFKRGMKGIYQHCGEQHLHRYLAEFDFRYSYRQGNGFDDGSRAVRALQGAVGKRLMYRERAISRLM